MRRDGGERSLTLRVAEDRRAMTEPGKLLPGLGFDLATWNAATLIHEVPAGSAGARAGLQASDRVLGGRRPARGQQHRIRRPGERRAGPRYFD